MKTKITIVGGGSSAYSLIAFLSNSKYEIKLLTSQPDQWHHHPQLKVQTSESGFESIQGKIDKVSNDHSLLIPDSDVIVLCMPVHQYYNTLKKIAPSIDKDKLVFIGTMYGQGGFNWMAESILAPLNIRHAVIFSIGLLPWICRTEQYGKIGINYGSKSRNVVALSDQSKFEHLNSIFLNEICYKWFDKGEFYLADNFLSLTLSVDNQIIHPARCYSLHQQSGGSWKNYSDIPYFYKDFDENSADTLIKLDSEYSKIRNTIMSRYSEHNFSYMLDYLSLERFSYNSGNTDVQESFRNSTTLSKIKPPVSHDDTGFSIDTSHRFFTDDIEYGLCIAKWFAKKLDISTPVIDEITKWAASTSASIKSLVRGLPENYGLYELDDTIN